MQLQQVRKKSRSQQPNSDIKIYQKAAQGAVRRLNSPENGAQDHVFIEGCQEIAIFCRYSGGYYSLVHYRIKDEHRQFMLGFERKAFASAEERLTEMGMSQTAYIELNTAYAGYLIGGDQFVFAAVLPNAGQQTPVVLTNLRDCFLAGCREEQTPTFAPCTNAT